MEAWQVMRLRKHHLVLLLMILISGFIWSQMVIYALHELFGFNPRWGIAQYCVAVLSGKLFWHQAVLIGLSVIIAYSFGTILRVLCSQIANQRKWNRHVGDNQHARLTAQMNRKYRNRGYEVAVIRHESIVALTSGFRRPRIILSTALISECTDREIDAVVMHECSHCRQYDPMRMLVIKIMTDSLPFIPLLKRLSHYIHVWVELEADQYSIKRMRSQVDLASVLLRCSNASKNSPNRTVGIGFADEAINYRLLQLIEPKRKIRVPLFDFIPLWISLAAIFALTGMIISGCT
ncbi:MAG TPA: M56 family metallopeptidase [Paenibacillus sp.]|uniref:M56 family metallopeptidase n=1 Tax=Paenibacillus sp. TaxID=58172 RepID=UPI0028D8AC5E|nr:M56 family metallopeptidase [Paenibacillus sp.]HUC91785.1 M56 family metallopeptidase [Paenibacillus sp.]